MQLFVQFFIGLFLAVIIAVLAWRAGSLTISGVAAAILTGGLIFGLGGWAWAALLLTFFISSSGLSRAFSQRKAALSEKFSKGSQRDWGQVLANGGLGALLAIAYILLPRPGWLWLAFAGAMAAVNADTWSTELGVLSMVPPRLITSGKPVERGTSGGITLAGTLAALGGALLVAIVALLFTPGSFRGIAGTGWYLELGIIVFAGLLGSLFDSLLGATLQAIYWCPTCQKETERYPVHTCGSQTTQVRGLSWLNNDMVNFACSIMGAIIAAGLWLLLV